MADRRRVVRFEELESDESDESLSISHQYHVLSSIEDLLNEIEVARRYRRMLNMNRPGLSPKSPRASTKSKAIQTDIDASSISPLWSKALCLLVDELHNNIGNLLNTLFHSPDGSSRGVVAEYELLKFFNFADGFWQSKYFPHIKVPASAFEARIYSGSLEHDMKRLLKTAELLKNTTSYLTDYECETSGKEQQGAVPDEVLGAQTSSSETLKQSKTLGMKKLKLVASSSSRPPLFSGSSKCECSSNIYRLQASVPKAQVPRLVDKPVGTFQSCSTRNGLIKEGDAASSSRLRRPLIPVAPSNNDIVGTSRDNVRVEPKANSHTTTGQQRNGQENRRHKVQPGYKNFIKRNIVAVSDPVIRSRASSGRCRYGCINI